MNYEVAARAVVDWMNASVPDDIQQNLLSKYGHKAYTLDHWHRYGDEHQALIYQRLDTWGHICWSFADRKCKTFADACEDMLRRYFGKKYNIKWETDTEFTLKAAIVGITI